MRSPSPAGACFWSRPLPALPWLKPTLRLACAAYLVAVAWGLWSRAGEALSGSGFGPHQVFTATLLNPKALLFAAVIFPEAAFQTSGAFLQTINVFAAVIIPIALAWIGFGSALSQPGFFIRPQTIQKGAALVLLTFSATLGAAALG